ncbi:MAG: OPT/YSL family transporter [Elusimicrobiota bacterium]
MDTGQQEYREITPAAVILGVILGIVMTMSFVYAGLKLGFTLGGSSIAAIVGFVILKGILKKGTIVENNINQTIASGVNIASAGIIFTLPALLLMGRDFPMWVMIVSAMGGSLLGITVIIPLRKQLIDLDRLRFPTGTAVAAILKSPGAGKEKAVLMGIGFVLSLGTVILIKYGYLPGEIPVGKWLGLPEYTQTGIYFSLMNFGAGMLAGAGGLAFALGGILAYWFIAPFAVGNGWVAPGSPEVVTDAIYHGMLRPLGIGLLIGGALIGIIVAFPAIKGAFKSLQQAAQTIKGGKGEGSDEVPIKVLYFGLVASVILLFFSAYMASDISVARAAVISIVGTVWIGVAGLIVAQATGLTDISPLSGLALIAVTLILAITGGDVVIAVLIGVAVCVATSQCADMMQDLKTGQMVGARPIRQQVMQYAVAWIGPLVAIGTVYLLWHTPDGSPGFGMNSDACVNKLPECLVAPQAGALEAMITGVLDGNAPVVKYVTGALIGGGLAVYPIGGLGVLVGLAFYLPFAITLGFGLGCLATMGIAKWKSSDFVEEKVVPLAAGLIIGEALTEVAYSMAQIVKGMF